MIASLVADWGSRTVWHGVRPSGSQKRNILSPVAKYDLIGPGPLMYAETVAAINLDIQITHRLIAAINPYC